MKSNPIEENECLCNKYCINKTWYCFTCNMSFCHLCKIDSIHEKDKHSFTNKLDFYKCDYEAIGNQLNEYKNKIEDNQPKVTEDLNISKEKIENYFDSIVEQIKEVKKNTLDFTEKFSQLKILSEKNLNSNLNFIDQTWRERIKELKEITNPDGSNCDDKNFLKFYHKFQQITKEDQIMNTDIDNFIKLSREFISYNNSIFWSIYELNQLVIDKKDKIELIIKEKDNSSCKIHAISTNAKDLKEKGKREDRINMII